ncbi:hypothetical protein NST04_27490 [Paenibacillus sp. FSL H7-0756]|uniref:hypothetical protein n=1 Tax=Paenibacillus sp. FSL H3-0469 TaxID=2954506 RepID=UPI0030FDE03D
MIQSLNKEIRVNELDEMMMELEERPEMVCFFHACGGDAGTVCLPVACAGYLGLGGGVCFLGI